MKRGEGQVYTVCTRAKLHVLFCVKPPSQFSRLGTQVFYMYVCLFVCIYLACWFRFPSFFSSSATTLATYVCSVLYTFTVCHVFVGYLVLAHTRTVQSD